MNTKPFLTNTWELRYIQNDFDKNAFFLDFWIKNSINHADNINCLLNISASKNQSGMVLYSKRRYLSQFSEDAGPIWFRFLLLEKFQKAWSGWAFLQCKKWVILGREFETLSLGFMRVPFGMGGSNVWKARNNFEVYDFLIFGPCRAKMVHPISRHSQQKKRAYDKFKPYIYSRSY